MFILTACADSIEMEYNVVKVNPDDPILRVELVYAGTHDSFKSDRILYNIYVNGMTDASQSYMSYWHYRRPDGVYRIWVEDLDEYYCQYTEANPYTVSLYKDTLVEIPITNTPTNKYKAIESPWVSGGNKSPAFGIFFTICGLMVMYLIRRKKIP